MHAVFKRVSLRRELPENVIDLWFVKLTEIGLSLEPLLSVDELRRVSRFRFDRDATNFVARRGILRLILATYTRVSPTQLSFTHNEYGKPALDGHFCNIRFSLSQSGESAVYAVAHQRDLGVDIEHLQQQKLEFASIARSFFSEEQIGALNETTADRKEELFLHLWTQLEARGKALGSGIGNLNSASSGSNAFYGKCFSFTRLVQSPGYVVALAVKGRRGCSLCALRFCAPVPTGRDKWSIAVANDAIH